MNRQVRYAMFYGGVPFAIVSGLFLFALGNRSDYLGHYAAGYGGTLCAAAMVLVLMAKTTFSHRAYAIGTCTLLCIAAGAVAEATVFRLAKFDEIDFFNQSLGAVMAGLVVLRLTRIPTVGDATLWAVVTLGVVAMILGVYFAFA